MELRVNGEPLALELKEGATLGEALAAADELLETAGAIIIGLKVDGADLAPENLSAMSDRSFSEKGTIDIIAESLSAIKSKAIRTLLELLSLSREAASTEGSGTQDGAATPASHTGSPSAGSPAAGSPAAGAADWPALADGLSNLADAFSGLFSADELSFVKGFSDLAQKAKNEAENAGKGGQAAASTRGEIARQAENLLILFKERLEEIESPKMEFSRAASLYRAQTGELSELPILLQTGKDERAMKAVLLFIEIFNKVIRLVPELEREGFDTGAARVGGQSIPEFYNSFNDILRRLSKAFEDRDTVLIGDLAEYEVVPRMTEFFDTVEEALAQP